MRYRHVLDRRTVLRGAGGVAIGLPFLEAMHAGSVWAQADPPPLRVVTFFFGLGVRPEHAAQGLTGPLAPLAPFAAKLGFSRQLNLGTSSSSANHDVGSQFVFRGVGNKGATIDQFVLDALHGANSPTAIKSLIAGTFHRNNGKRENHSFRPGGGVTDSIVRVPQKLFDRVFGQFDPGTAPPPTSPTPEESTPQVCEANKARHIRRSILDAVFEQYKYLSSDAAGLGATSRTQLADHMDKIRELELVIFGDAMQMSTDAVETALTHAVCTKPERPASFGGSAFTAIQQRLSDGQGGQTLDWADWDRLWRGMADIYAMAIICDRTRFGNLMFTSGGERLRVKGSYSWGGQTIAFNDPTTTHEYWHGWGRNSRHGGSHASRDWVGNHTHLLASRMAYFMTQLDAAKEGNGKTVLDNMLLLISTELGSGGQSHSLMDIFHAWTAAGGKLKVGGGIDFGGMDGTKFYNTIAKALVGKPMTGSAAPDSNSNGLLLA